MLRPATPLSILLGVAFVLLLLSVISVPIVKAIPLGSFRDVTLGVFGYCLSDGCSSIGVGYDLSRLAPKNMQQFDLPPGVRHTLSSILILHPIAAFLTLVMFIMAVAAHLHKASHSSRYLLVFFLLTLVDFLVCLAAFIVDVLLFIPHMAWGTYIVLAATILVFFSGLVSCAMRRTLISRKSRKKRIAENAEMSGENYYNRENHAPKPDYSMTTQPTMPTVSGGNGGQDSLPAFATFENQKDDQVSDERIPLTQRTTSERSPNAPHAMTTGIAAATTGEAGGFNGPSRTPSQDRYVNYSNGPAGAYGAARGGPYDRMNRTPPVRRGTDQSGEYGAAAAYGGYGAGRGGYGSSMRGRGGHGLPPRHAYAAGNMAPSGGRSPPPGYNNNYNGAGGQYDRSHADNRVPYGASQPSQSNPSVNQSVVSGGGGYKPYTPNAELPRAESPPPLPGAEFAASATPSNGPAIEMDATPAPHTNNYGQYGQIRDSDADVAGMVGLQQGQRQRPDTITSDASKYSEEPYVPPRAMWSEGSERSLPRAGSPADAMRGAATNLSGTTAAGGGAGGSRHNGNYYEDVDPQYGAQSAQPPRQRTPYSPPQTGLDYEEIRGVASGARSPAESERSNFTSISQRGINPRWQPQPPMPQQGPGYGSMPRRPVQQQRQDMILDNPDFKIPGGKSGAGQRGAAGMIPGSAYPTGRM